MRVIIRQIVLIAAGALLASSTLLNRWPKLLNTLNKVALYKNTLGVFALIFGAIDLLSILMFHSALVSEHYSTLMILVSCIFEIIVGFILAYGVTIKNWFKNNEKALHTFGDIYDKLIKYQTLIGLSAIGWAVVLIIMYV